jgi:hypothetical protein
LVARHGYVREEAFEARHGFFFAVEKLFAGSEHTPAQGALLQAAEPAGAVTCFDI